MQGMNGPIIPILGQQQQQQQQQQQAMAHQVVVSTYLSLIPVVAQTVLSHTDMYADQEQIPDRIADEAWRVTAAAVRKLGINIPDQRPGATVP